MAKRVRIFFINCPTLAIDAAAFLLLAQNKFQKVLQFEIVHFWIFSKAQKGKLNGFRGKAVSWRAEKQHRRVRWLGPKFRTMHDLRVAPVFSSELSLTNWEAVCRKAIADYDTWFSKCGYNSYDVIDAPTIILTETPLKGRYISYTMHDIALVSAAHWKEFFWPGSALEFILTSVQRTALRLCFGTKIGSHYPTRGCLWDFHCHQPDAKFSGFLGFLCETCRNGLKSNTSTEEYDEVIKLIQNDWVGNESDIGSIAGILKKNYSYPLSRSTGLKPSHWLAIWDSIKSELGKNVVEGIKWIVILAVLTLFISYFPGLTERLRDFFSGDKDKTKIENQVDQEKAKQTHTRAPDTMASSATEPAR